ncbi:hypothetical protein [Streptomyces sp. NPDC020298]|uniref:hypothetical protein n=1 Tax=unclassified Streptomyces TaxID=2593676 RepID=UPI0033FE70F5
MKPFNRKITPVKVGNNTKYEVENDPMPQLYNTPEQAQERTQALNTQDALRGVTRTSS